MSAFVNVIAAFGVCRSYGFNKYGIVMLMVRYNVPCAVRLLSIFVIFCGSNLVIVKVTAVKINFEAGAEKRMLISGILCVSKCTAIDVHVGRKCETAVRIIILIHGPGTAIDSGFFARIARPNDGGFIVVFSIIEIRDTLTCTYTVDNGDVTVSKRNQVAATVRVGEGVTVKVKCDVFLYL